MDKTILKEEVKMKNLENLHFKATGIMPSIAFHTSGELKIAGRIIPENGVAFFETLFNWVGNLNAGKVSFDIQLEYINTSASMLLFHLLQKLEDNEAISEVSVNWHYEEDDEDHYETGLIYEERLTRTRFAFLSYV